MQFQESALRNRWIPLAIGIAVALILAVGVHALLSLSAAKRQLEAGEQARAALGEARTAIDRRLETALAVPETLAAVIAVQQRIDLPTFNAIAERLIAANPSIRNVALAPDNVITAIYPVRGNEATQGLRYAEVPEQHEAVLRAARSGRTVVAGPQALVQGGTGLLSRTPVFVADDDGQTQRYWGIVSLAVDTDRLFEDIDKIGHQSDFEIAVRRGGNGDGEVFAGSATVFAQAPLTLAYPLPGGEEWQLGVVPSGGWQARGSWPLALWLFAYLFAAVSGWLLYRGIASHEQARRLARRDSLTGLANRIAFEHRLGVLLAEKPGSCALVLIDLDRFKPINDNHGHQAGDTALRAIAGRLQTELRATDTVYRLGGDEFAILLQDVRGIASVTGVVERALARLHRPVVLDGGEEVAIGATAGVAMFPLGGKSERAVEVFARADRALYRGKEEGGGSVRADPQVSGGAAGPPA